MALDCKNLTPRLSTMIFNYNPCFLLASLNFSEKVGEVSKSKSLKSFSIQSIPASSIALLKATESLNFFFSSLLANTFIKPKVKRSPIKDILFSFLISREQVYSKGNLQSKHLPLTKEGDLHRTVSQQGSVTCLKFFVKKK